MSNHTIRPQAPGRRKLAVTAGALLGFSLGASALHAGEMPMSSKGGMPPAPEDKDWCDSLWGYTTLYKDPNNAFLQELSFTGRFQADYGFVDGNTPDDDATWDGYNTRRFRAGLKAKIFQDFILHGEVDLDPDDGLFYNKLTDAYIAYAPSKAFKLTVGKHSMPFTQEGSTSSKEILTIDRSALANNLWFPEEYLPGVSVSGTKDNWVYHTGLYSSGAASPEFGDFDGGLAYLASLGYDFASQMGVDQALLRFDYVYNDPNENNSFTRNLENIGSLNFNMKNGKFGLRTDLAGATGYFGQPDLWAVMVMPFYDLTEKIQVVTRYTHVESDGNDGVRFSRYETEAVSGRGDSYDEIFLGLNYYICGNKLKFQTGVDYANMNDDAHNGGEYDGWGVTGAFRLSW